MGVTSCRFKSIFPSATTQRPKILHGYVLFTSRTTTPNNVESGRSFSSPSAPFCWKSTWKWSLTATEVLGATQLVTTWRKLLPTPIFQHHLATHRCGAQGQCQVNGPMCVVLSSPRTLVTNEDSPAWSFHCSARPWASVRETKVAIMRYGCTWTLSAFNLLMSHGKTRAAGSPPRKVLSKPTQQGERQI